MNVRNKKINILIPCYNEEGNILDIYNTVKDILDKKLPSYNYEIIFIDNFSTDTTRILIRNICDRDPKVKAIFNIRNFGSATSSYYGICQTTGDCTILLSADFQEPIELISTFVNEWEKGYKLVIGIKHKSKENPIKRQLRTLYYKLFKKISENVDQIEHFDGFGLYDKSFVDVMRNLHEPTPYIKTIVAEFGSKHKYVYYTQQRRKSGKSHISWYTLYDDAMLTFTTYTKIGPRIAVLVGFIISIISFGLFFLYLIIKLIYWDLFIIGQALLIIGMVFLGALQLFFIGLLGEYVMSINARVMNRPLVIEEERINFEE
ncbi:MAG: glycosyltransferase family 2 protein [Endomicrobium sp.]|jgi:glycosyltransferase involved in cell wall biosynthesis|nr:glycosyltransferase family 2 protein [Endomicrobium sp.]